MLSWRQSDGFVGEKNLGWVKRGTLGLPWVALVCLGLPKGWAVELSYGVYYEAICVTFDLQAAAYTERANIKRILWGWERQWCKPLRENREIEIVEIARLADALVLTFDWSPSVWRLSLPLSLIINLGLTICISLSSLFDSFVCLLVCPSLI